MGGRHTFAFRVNASFQWKTVGTFQGVKVLEGNGGLHKLPEEAHSGDAYVQLFPDGNLQMIRFYDADHFLTVEIGYHAEPELTGHYRRVYHIHFYDRSFRRTDARLLTPAEIKKYERFFTVKGAFK